MEFRVLGPVEVVDEGRVLRLGSGRQLALVAVLLLHANEPVSIDRLVDDLWGETPPPTAAKIVRNSVSLLRRELGDRLVTRRPGYLLRVEAGELDSELLEHALESGEIEELSKALALWRGQPLSQFAYERFAQDEIVRLEELRLAAIEARIDAQLALGRHANVIPEAETLVHQHPLRERLRGQLMLALYRSGRQAEALAAYQQARRSLDEQLGIEPGPALRDLERKILNQDESLDARVAPSEPSPLPEAAREERKLVSILSVDIVGFASGTDLADPEDARAALQPFHAAAEREIERHGGTLEKSIGDAVTAVFGAPAAHENDAERAVRAALAIRRWISEESQGLQVRMAVNTGVALVSPAEKTLAAGDVVNTAQRLQVAAPVNGILVGEQTYRATLEAIDYREVAPVEAEGKPEPTPVWEAREARSSRREATTPFVGRRRELELLVSAVGRVREERSAQLITLVGVPGIGKSRLVFELSKAIEDEQLTWRQGRCLPYGDGVSFWALGEMVKAQAGILESDSRDAAEQKLGAAIAELVIEPRETRWVERHLRPLIGGAGEIGSGEHSGETFAAWRRFLEAVADLSPLVLVLEDLHWADDGLLEFVDELADRIRDAPLLVLCTARPELLHRRPTWGGGKTNVLTISVPPLSDDETGRIVASALEQPELEANVHEALLARAAGNPLYAEQFARMLTEVGSLDELPESVHGIIAARLDGLGDQEKALLQDAAVVGKVFWLGALEAITDRSVGQAEGLLDGLERKEFVQQARRSAVAGVAEYAFRHLLLRDVAYGQIPRADRGEKHRRAAAWIESLGRSDDHAEMLAHHYLNALEYAETAGEPDPLLAERARIALRAAGGRAVALASYAPAARFYSAALELWHENDPDRVWLLVDAGRASYGANESGIDLLEQAFDELRARGDADGAAEVAVELARCFWTSGDRDATYSHVDQALDLAEGRAGSRARMHALVARAAYHLAASEYSQAVDLAREALPLTETMRRDDLRARSLDVLGHARVLSGDAGGLDDSTLAVELARESDAFTYLLIAEFNLYISRFFLAQVAAATEALQAFRDDVESYGSAYLRRVLRGAEASEAVLHGRWEKATQILEELIAEADAGAARHYGEPAWRTLSASIELARGDLEGASAASAKALDRARTTKDAQLLAPALTLRGIVLVAQGRREEAAGLASEVLALGSTLIAALLSWFPTATPVEFAWLLRDLEREAGLLAALESAPSTPWVEAARAIARREDEAAVALIAGIGAPSVEAYARLRVAEELARAGRNEEARHCLSPAIVFFRDVSATRSLDQAELLLAASV